jgi:hypothetical protein
MKNKIFRAFVLIGVLGNVGVGISYLVTGVWSIAIMHIAFGIATAPVYFESKNDDKNRI